MYLLNEIVDLETVVGFKFALKNWLRDIQQG